MLIAKTIIYRVLRILIVLLVTLMVTGSIGNALSISMIDAVIASIYYYYFDKYWYLCENYLTHLWYVIKYTKMNF